VIILGVDPGLNGGLALVRVDVAGGVDLLAVRETPTTGEKAKRRIDVPRVLEFVRSPGRTPDHAFIERAQAMPDQGASSGFIYGRAVGALEACVEGLMVPHTIIESAAWKKAHGLIKREKEDSRQRAIKLFPRSRGFERKLDHNRAEAALIAWYGAMLLKSGSVRRAAEAAQQATLV
jgi:crossover junction endodeoxyribonuclease RuvC